MAYVQRFTDIPACPTGTTGLHAVSKLRSRNGPRYEIIAASQIARGIGASGIITKLCTRHVIVHRPGSPTSSDANIIENRAQGEHLCTITFHANQMLRTIAIAYRGTESFAAHAIATNPASPELKRMPNCKTVPLFSVEMGEMIISQSTYRTFIVLLFHFAGPGSGIIVPTRSTLSIHGLSKL
ncbi:hypothetical protein FRC11_009178 [Ceratobasidium sp. 423]|nr:hypothetical protein FRC11_009178 [Ceratobasidium sp. 423]